MEIIINSYKNKKKINVIIAGINGIKIEES